jgi:hypothetical protein
MPTDRQQKRTERIQLMLDDDELTAIDDWRFEHRLPSRAAAIRELIKRGFLNRNLEPPDTRASTTRDFSALPDDESYS